MMLIVAIIFSLSLLYIFMFSLGQLDLTYNYIKAKGEAKNSPELLPNTFEEFPMVTVQLPIYNEQYVVQRLLNSIASLDYPKVKLEIQVLDDSNDKTVEIIQHQIKALKSAGYDIKSIRRPNRKGFKAGALKYGLEKAKGDLLVIFDADFLPEPDFLKKTIPYFEDDQLGVVQTRWEHVNKDFSLLTRLQAFGLDAHFTVEQIGRSRAGSFINFNGTAGIWRKSCIVNAGGWSDDTLTEDLDLSYRAQLKGWKFKFLEKVGAPAELPVLMSAVKSQQYRWNKGAAESARKNLGKVFKSGIGFRNKMHAAFHLLNSSVFVSLLIAAILSIPMLFIKQFSPFYDVLFKIGIFLLIGFFSIAFFYWVATKNVIRERSFFYFLKVFPIFMIVSMGLSLHNGIAVMEGLWGKKTPFIRTPKFNIMEGQKKWQKNVYIKNKINIQTIIEGILCLYFIFGISMGLIMRDFTMIIFHTMLAIGFASVFYYSVKSVFYGQPK